MSLIVRPPVNRNDIRPLPLRASAARDRSDSEAGRDEPVSVAVVRGRQGFESIRGEWQVFVDRQGARLPLAYAPEWYDAYLGTTEDPDRVFFFVARRNAEIVAIFPFERRVLFVLGVPIPAWILPYHDHMPFSDALAPLEELSDLLPLLLEALKKQGAWALLVARNVIIESVAGAIAENSSFRRRLSQQRGDCHYLDCAQSYESLLATFSRKHRANLRRHRNNLSALGTLEVARITDIAMMDRSFADFLEVESSGWKGRGGKGTAIALHPELERYYRRLLKTFGSRGACELNILRLNGACIAAQFCVTIGGAWYLLKIGYDEQYAKYSPGSLLLEDVLIRLCADREVNVANLASDASWHLNWNPRSLEMANYYIGAPGPAGSLAVSLVSLRMRVGRDLQRLRNRMAVLWRATRGLLARESAGTARE
jgi:CelD/BcsL family acetyltransferase involved in cellulose biosynthesis